MLGAYTFIIIFDSGARISSSIPSSLITTEKNHIQLFSLSNIIVEPYFISLKDAKKNKIKSGFISFVTYVLILGCKNDL